MRGTTTMATHTFHPDAYSNTHEACTECGAAAGSPCDFTPDAEL